MGDNLPPVDVGDNLQLDTVCAQTPRLPVRLLFGNNLPCPSFPFCSEIRPERPFTGVSGPSRPEGPECPKSLEKSQEVLKKCQKDFLTLFETFSTLQAGRPGETFLRLFWGFRGWRLL